jgi:hypothetical protein
MMTTRRMLLTLGGLSLLRHANAQVGNAGLIPYRKLTWRDFPIRDVRAEGERTARTEARILWTYKSRWSEQRRGSFVAHVESCELRCYFDPRRSWRRRNLGPAPDKLLAHEQSHLDLTYLHMLRLLRVPLNDLGLGVGESSGAAEAHLEVQVGRYFSDSIAEHQRVHDRFDQETNHGLDDAMQQVWEKRIIRAIAQHAPPPR